MYMLYQHDCLPRNLYHSPNNVNSSLTHFTHALFLRLFVLLTSLINLLKLLIYGLYFRFNALWLAAF